MIHASSPYDSIYPRHYIAYRSTTTKPLTIDGNLDKPFWNDVEWTDNFVDISTETTPKFQTKVKMRWDDKFLYVGAYMEETDVWATLKEKNSVIFHDNDFEVFVDTDGTNHNYKEFEINALGTIWCLHLNKPYDNGGIENSKRVDLVDGYDMEPTLRSAVKVYPKDAINDPATPNTHWTAEIALPITKLMEQNSFAKFPADGVFWRVNFSRVQWGLKQNTDGFYQKDPCCQSCAKPGTAAEDNWVWSKQGEVAMHLPERWGILQFHTSLDSSNPFQLYEEWPVRCAAMAVYYAMVGYQDKQGIYTTDIEALKSFANPMFPILEGAATSINLTAKGFEAKVTIGFMTAHVDEERYLMVSLQGSTAYTE